MALVLNAVLFLQTSATSMSAGDINNAILAVVGGLLPGSMRAPSQHPVTTPSPAIAVTGGS